MPALTRDATLSVILAPWRAIRAAYLRYLIRSAERDIHWAQLDLAGLPQQIAAHRHHLAALQVRLIDLGDRS